jgi:tetratricopeptide (TPR) repeat protein
MSTLNVFRNWCRTYCDSTARGISMLIALSTIPLLAPGACATSVECIDLNNQANVCVKQGKDLDKAIVLLTRVLKKDPTYTVAAINLSIAYNSLGVSLKGKDREQALHCFETALYVVPSNDSARTNLHGMLKLMGLPDTAQTYRTLGDKRAEKGDVSAAAVEY